MDRATAVIVTLVVGGLVALQAPANALLGRMVGDLGAAFVSLVFSTAIVGTLLVVAGDPGQLSGVTGIRPEHLLGGIAGAAIVLVGLITVRTLGAGGVTAALIATQLIVSVAADRLGVLGLDPSPLSLRVWLGSALLLAGALLLTAR